MILYQRKEGGHISVQLNAHKMKKDSLTLPPWNTLQTPGQAVSKMSQVRTSSANFKPHEEDLSLIHASQEQNVKFQATGSPHLTEVFSIFREYGTDEKVSALHKTYLNL